jgi:hypothetical protein
MMGRIDMYDVTGRASQSGEAEVTRRMTGDDGHYHTFTETIDGTVDLIRALDRGIAQAALAAGAFAVVRATECRVGGRCESQACEAYDGPDQSEWGRTS